MGNKIPPVDQQDCTGADRAPSRGEGNQSRKTGAEKDQKTLKMAEKHLEIGPQVGTADSGESHPALSGAGCPSDSGEGNLPLPERRNSIIDLVWDEEEGESKSKSKDKNLDDSVRSMGVAKSVLAKTYRTTRSCSVGNISPRSKKRKPGDMDHSFFADHEVYKKKECTEVFVLNQTIEAITKISKKMDKCVEQNTRRELKELIVKLARQVEVLNRNIIQGWIKNHEFERDPSLYIDTETQTPEDGSVLTIEEADNYNSIIDKMDREWDRSVFTNTEIKTGNPLKINEVHTKVLITETKRNVVERGIERAFIERFPELSSAAGNIVVLEQLSKIKSTNEGNTVRKKIIKAQWDGREEELFDLCKLIQTETKGDNCILFHELRGIDITRMRKILEAVYHNTETTATIMQISADPTNIAKNKSGRKTYALVVGQEGKNFKETLHEVRSSLMKDIPGHSGIRSIKEAKNGQVLITLDKDMGLLERVAKNLENTRTIVRRKTEKLETLFIRGMDAITTKEEVQKALLIEIPDLLTREHKISDLRPAVGGTQAITFSADAVTTQKLETKKYIRIGLTSCKVVKKIALQRCSKCWAYDHEAKNCAGVDRGNACFRCGEIGHSAKECKNEENCPLCHKLGHRSGSGQCESFKRALKEAKKQISKNTVP